MELCNKIEFFLFRNKFYISPTDTAAAPLVFLLEYPIAFLKGYSFTIIIIIHDFYY